MISKFYTKFFIGLLVFLGSVVAVSAQTTEDFETETAGTTHFSDNGVGFTLFDALLVNPNSGTAGGYGGSAKYLENTNTPGPGVGSSARIKTDASALITLKSLYFNAATSAAGFPPSADGTVTFEGKLGGVSKFIVVKSTGFNTSSSLPGNGYALVNFATEGGINHSNINIDELVITLGGNFQYFAIDNFTWAIGTLPVNLLSYTAVLKNEKPVLDWKTAAEVNNSYFTIERSINGTDFVQIATIRGKGTTPLISEYEYTDESPADGINYYRLKQYDLDGKVKDHGIRTVTMSAKGSAFKAYPNPMTLSTLTIEPGSMAPGSEYRVADLSGRIVLAGRISATKQDIDVSGLQKGIFILHLSNGKSVKLVKN